MTDEQQPPLNREQRRAKKFRSKSTARQDNLHTQHENDTGFLATSTDSLADGPRDDAVIATTAAPADRTEASAASANAPAYSTDSAQRAAAAEPPSGA